MLHPRIFRALEEKLARPLAHIFNNSVETEIIPEDWKSENVTHKSQKNTKNESQKMKQIRTWKLQTH